MADDAVKPPLSPAWRRPTDIMKIRSKRRKSPTAERAPLRPFNDLKSPPRDPQPSPARKRRNPFTCSPNRKRPNLGHENEDVNADSDFLLFQMLDKADGAFSPPSNNSPSVSENVFDNVDETDIVSQLKQEQPQEEDPGYMLMPLDWSLKTKVRFVSAKPFTWSGPLKTQDEANGVSLYVRKSSELPDSELGEQAELKSCTMYWMHPNIPWLTLFPRQVQDNRIGKPSAAILDENMLAQLHRDWTQSFASLYNLLKANVCPYFYVLSCQFSVLFRSASICGGRQNALLTPTTRGFREAVANEGIKFTMPLAGTTDPKKVDTDLGQNSLEDEIQNTDSGASLFLESIGLDKQKFPELNPEKVKMEREDYKRIDSRPESLIQVEAEDTKQLFNYLLNCRSCIANTGVQRGIPPTLLAPVAFNGGTLKSMQMKQGSVRQTGPNNLPMKMFTLEIGSTVLPDSLARITDLMSRTQGNFSATLSMHEPTATFNDVNVNCQTYFSSEENTFLSKERDQMEGAIRSMEFRKERYFCSNTGYLIRPK